MLLIVTRPPAQAEPWVRELRALGQQAQALPLIHIVPAADAAPVGAAWAALDQFALVCFVSANAVAHFFALAQAGAAWPVQVLAGSTGPGTSAALRAAGVPVQAIVEPAADAENFDSEALWSRLSLRAWDGRRVLVVRGEDGRDWLADKLTAQGAQVEFVAAYGRRTPRLGAAEQRLLNEALAAPASHLWLFSSSQAVHHLQSLAPAADWSAGQAITSHPRIAQAARAAGFGRVDMVAPTPAAVALTAATWTGSGRAPLQSAPS